MRLSTQYIDQLSHLCYRIKQTYGFDSSWGIAGINSDIIITVCLSDAVVAVQLPSVLKAASVTAISDANLDVLAYKVVELAKIQIVDSLRIIK